MLTSLRCEALQLIYWLCFCRRLTVPVVIGLGWRWQLLAVLAETAGAGGVVARQPAGAMPARGWSRRFARRVLLLASNVNFGHHYGPHVHLAAVLMSAGKH
jgi:hypothetical protein